MAVAEAEVPTEPAKSFDGRAEATRTTDELFQWSTYVHAGSGAPECVNRENGSCRDTEHFHAWLRLPNDWQAGDIQEKANAARARKRRALKDPESDARVNLEDWLEGWLENDRDYENLLGRIANRRVIEETPQIRRDLLEGDDFENYPADYEEYQRLLSLPEGDRDPEEFTRLDAHIKSFIDLFTERTIAERERQLFELRKLDKAAVADIERTDRIKELADERFVQIYYQWAYFICVLKPVAKGYPVNRVFESPEALRTTPQEVARALRDAYRKLESGTVSRGDVAGNS